MKIFQILFFLFLCFSSVAFGASTDERLHQKIQDLKRAYPDDDLVSAYVQDMASGMAQSLQEAKQTAGKDINLIDDSDNFNFFNFLYLQEDSSMLTGRKGLEKWHNLPFGDFRLISCTGNTTTTGTLLLGLQARIKEGWQLKKPVIPPYNDLDRPQGIIREDILYPIQDVLLHNTTYYTQDSYFLLRYDMKDVAPETLFSKEITLTAEQNGQSETVTELFQLPLTKADVAYQTDVCAPLMHELQQTPLPVEQEEVTAQVFVQQEHLVQINLFFKEKISYINLQIDTPKEWDLENKHILGNKVQFLIHFKDEVSLGEELSLKVLSSAGWYDYKATVQEGNFLFFPARINIFLYLISGLCLFFLSPALTYFCALNPKNLQQEIYKLQKVVLTGTSLFAVGFLVHIIPQNIFETHLLGLIIGVITALYLLKNPQISLSAFIILFLLFPKPYLAHIQNLLTRYDIVSYAVFAFWAGCLFLPFFLLKKQAVFLSYLQKSGFSFALFRRVPAIFALGWCLFVLLFSYSIPREKFSSPDQITREINQGNIVYLSVENGYCLRCLLNQNILYYFYNKNDLAQRQIKFITLDTRTTKGDVFLRQKMLPNDSFALLYGNKKPYGVMVEGYQAPDSWTTTLVLLHDLPSPLENYMHTEKLEEMRAQKAKKKQQAESASEEVVTPSDESLSEDNTTLLSE